MCCSELAGRWLFGNKEYDKGNVYLLNNAIDLDKFKYDEKLRKETRKELNIKDSTIVIGCIGRFVEQKNHTFLIDIFNEVHKQNKDSILLLAGQGPLENEINLKVNELGLSESVLFLGQKNDVNKYYSVFDCYVMPSIYEGLGMVYIEAQVSGLSCVASNEVPSIAKINDNFKFIGLDEDVSVWIEAIQELSNLERKDCSKQVASNGYDINKEVKKLEKKYSGMWAAKND